MWRRELSRSEQWRELSWSDHTQQAMSHQWRQLSVQWQQWSELWRSEHTIERAMTTECAMTTERTMAAMEE